MDILKALKKGLWDLKAYLLVSLLRECLHAPGGYIEEGPWRWGEKAHYPVCPGFQQLIGRIPNLMVPQPSQHSEIITWIDSLRLELLQEVAGRFSLASWQAWLPEGIFPVGLACMSQGQLLFGVKLCPLGYNHSFSCYFICSLIQFLLHAWYGADGGHTL